MSVTRRRRDDSGAVAVLFAIVALVILSIAALAVDLGNAMARNTNSQTQADFAAFAAAQELDTTAPPAGSPVPAAVVTSVRDYLNHNQPQDDDQSCAATNTCVTSAQLTDGNLANGEVRFVTDGLQVVAPKTRVDFGFAKIFGQDGTYVDATATVNVFSRGVRVMPMFAVSGCDYGRQNLTDPAGGGGAPAGTAPTITPNDSSPGLSISPILKNSAGTVVTEIGLNSTGNMIALTATGWDKSTAIGFFPDGATNTPAQAVPQGTFWQAGDATRTDLSPDTKPTGMSDADYAKLYRNTGTATVEAMIPDTVAATEGIWWVRVYNGPTSAGMPTSAGKWSRDAVPIRVGGAVLECAAGSTDGNFGTLKLPRTDGPEADDLPVNIADGLQKPLTPTIHQWAKDNPTSAGYCTHTVDGAVESIGENLEPGTNCVDTDTGLAANVATQGMITGAGGYPGMLTTQMTKSGCGVSNRSVSINPGPARDINNDILTCYLTDSSTSLATISNGSYAGPAVLDPSIFSSPRFIWVPVLAIQPVSGGSSRYSIVDYRPAFITDEEATAAATKGSHTHTSDNGLIIQNNDIKQIKVVFFDIDALPNKGSTPLIDFLGVGDPVVKLVD